ncbi:MAG: UvrD-helicase domain-containing protein [Desulfobacterales bacterium]|nr:UvrD-helicase domain-containing protein [Desulfobacterales bacterium]
MPISSAPVPDFPPLERLQACLGLRSGPRDPKRQPRRRRTPSSTPAQRAASRRPRRSAAEMGRQLLHLKVPPDRTRPIGARAAQAASATCSPSTTCCVRVARALRHRRGQAAWSTPCGGSYRAVLVDEFQDTDELQYADFLAAVFGTRRRLLFMIGDPKQAIYGFRGADIFSYLRAARSAAVDLHPRPTTAAPRPAWCTAVNTLFSQSSRPVPVSEISISPRARRQQRAAGRRTRRWSSGTSIRGGMRDDGKPLTNPGDASR